MMIVGGLSQDYRAAQLHFHWGSSSSPGSEHTVNAQRFPGEIHVVHYSMEYESINDAKNQPGGLAVLAAFIQEGPELNPTYEQLLSHLREVEEEGKSIEIPGFDIHGLLPQRLDRYYRYNGSLTTPPCYQSVNWTLFNQTVSLSQEQLAVLENTVHSEHDHILQLNFREPQRLNGRHVLTSFKSPIGGRRGPGAAPDPAVVSPAPGDSTSHRSGQGAEGSGAHALSTGDMLAVIFGVLFGVTAVAFLVYVRKTRSRNQRLGSENKSVIYKAATTDENLA
ncbi:carbonic anhydrase 9-like isoform X1 [Ascaphus truei]|uniref:carbonic anhydrase 9-like isoform X1 n=1 Tax=Ascaphus truei TaxID=8439 RepID=UPI003F594E8C